jgi:hypothetical protein
VHIEDVCETQAPIRGLTAPLAICAENKPFEHRLAYPNVMRGLRDRNSPIELPTLDLESRSIYVREDLNHKGRVVSRGLTAERTVQLQRMTAR